MGIQIWGYMDIPTQWNEYSLNEIIFISTFPFSSIIISAFESHFD